MGRYATTTSISLLLPNWLSGNTTTSDTYGTAIWDQASVDAEGEVNSSLVARYDPSSWTTTGTPAIPPLVIKLTQDLACLYAVRAAITQDAQVKNMDLDKWERAHQTLAEIQSGDKKLAYTDGSLVPSRSGQRISSSTQNYAHIFGVDDEKRWGVDSQQIDDLESERS